MSRMQNKAAEIASAILNLIRSNGSITRTEVAAELCLSKSTGTVYANKLLEARILKEEPGSTKKRTTLKINESAGVILGIDLDDTSLSISLCDLDAKIVDSSIVGMDIKIGSAEVMRRIFAEVDNLLERNDIKKNTLLGVGMGVPGGVDMNSGFLIAPPDMPGWGKFEIRKTLEDHFGCPAVADNDANIMALGEKTSGFGKNCDNFLFVKIGTGIGAGFFINNHLYHARSACEGDIGHIPVEGEEVLCRCGKRGCLEAVAGAAAIAKKAEEKAKNGESVLLAEMLKQNGSIDCHMVGSAASQGDPASIMIINEAGRNIGKVLAGVVNFINPPLIVIGGSVSTLGEMFLASIREVIYARSTVAATTQLQIKRSERVEEIGMLGASEMALAEVFSPGPISQMIETSSVTAESINTHRKV